MTVTGISLAEAGRRARVAKGVVGRWVAAGDLVPIGRAGRAILVDPSDVDRLAAARRAPVPRLPLGPLLDCGGWRIDTAADEPEAKERSKRPARTRSLFIRSARCSNGTLREWEKHGVPVWTADRLAVRLLNRTPVEVWGDEWESAWPDEATA